MAVIAGAVHYVPEQSDWFDIGGRCLGLPIAEQGPGEALVFVMPAGGLATRSVAPRHDGWGTGAPYPPNTWHPADSCHAGQGQWAASRAGLPEYPGTRDVIIVITPAGERRLHGDGYNTDDEFNLLVFDGTTQVAAFRPGGWLGVHREPATDPGP